MSTMNAMLGRSAAMRVKFWSGATPRYTPPRAMRRVSDGMTHCSDVSLETKFSERKVPAGSEYSCISRQKVVSASRIGTREDATPGIGSRATPALRHEQKATSAAVSTARFIPDVLRKHASRIEHLVITSME